MTKLIQNIISWYSSKYADNKELFDQLKKANIKSIKYTGIGFDISLELERETNKIGNVNFFPLDGPQIFSKSIDTFAEVLLWQSDGYISSIEIYTTGDFIEEHLSDFYLQE